MSRLIRGQLRKFVLSARTREAPEGDASWKILGMRKLVEVGCDCICRNLYYTVNSSRIAFLYFKIATHEHGDGFYPQISIITIVSLCPSCHLVILPFCDIVYNTATQRVPMFVCEHRSSCFVLSQTPNLNCVYA